MGCLMNKKFNELLGLDNWFSSLDIPIDRFDGTMYKFLSNFYPSEVEFEGKTYPTVEHAYQAAKTSNENDREKIRLASTPGKAKKLGQIVSLSSEWETTKLAVMEALLRKKFSITELQKALIETYPCKLIEGNTWNDTFWGMCHGVGKNHLGLLLMKIRYDLV